MYTIPRYARTLFAGKEARVNNRKEGESIEMKVKRLVENKEPIKDGAPLIYTPKNEGVGPAYNIRTDRFELATDAMDKVNKSKIAKSEEIIKGPDGAVDSEGKVIKGDFGKTESTPGTGTTK